MDSTNKKINSHTTITTDPILVFYQYTCPHCNMENTRSKSQKKKIVLCSNTQCRRTIILDNIDLVDEKVA